MNRKRQVPTLLVAFVAALALSATAVLAATPMNGARSQTTCCRLSRNCLRLGMVQRLAVARSFTRLSAIKWV